jgi:antitoxin PrlF
MAESTITAKGQTTVPQQIREAIGATTGTRLIWHVLPDGALIVRAKNKSVLELAGTLEVPPGTHVAVEDMNPWR